MGGRNLAKKSLTELCRVIRSKNAGPFELTLDLIFSDEKEYERVKAAQAVDRKLISRLYQIPEEDVLSLVYFDPARAIKSTIKRPFPAGVVEETDVYGAQQHAPLLEVELELPDFDSKNQLG